MNNTTLLETARPQTYPHLQPPRFSRRLRSGVSALLAVLALAVLAVPTRSFAQVPTFNTVIATPTGSQPWQPPRPAAVGDFDRDGKLDALIVDGSPTARFMRGNGDGTFAEINIDASMMTANNMVGLPANLVQYMPKSIDGYMAIKTADVNGDGKLDAICVTTVHINWGPYSLITVLTNTGNDANGVPQFATTYYFLGFYDVRSLTVGDLNGDGKPDFIVGGAYGQLLVYLNNGDGTFHLSQYTYIMPNVGGAVGAGVIADVNGDGKADFIVTDGQAGANNIFFGNGDGTLQAPIVQTPAASSIAVADLNNDGKPDLIEGMADGSVSVFLGNGDGTFGSPANFPTVAGGGASGFFISDVNGDGKLDVAVSLYSAGKVAILTGNGDGTLSVPYLYGGIPHAVDVTLADFTGDGKPEIASASPNGYGGQNFDVLVNTTVFAPAAQLFFTDPLTGPTSPNLATIPAGKYSYTASGLERAQSASDTDRPTVSTAVKTYLASATGNFAAEITVTIADNDIAYFGLGQGDADPLYNGEPAHAFYFRAHNNFQNGGAGYYGIQAMVRATTGNYLVDTQPGTYSPGSAVTLRITHIGDNVTMSIVGGGSVTYSLSSFQSALGLTDSNTKVFFGNTSVGTTFSNLKIYPLPNDTTPPVITAPANITAEATSPGGAAVNFSATAQDDVDGPVNVTVSQPSGSTFPLGITTVNLTASDAAGNTANASFTISVRDTIPPVISPVANITSEATSAAGAVATFAATATDAVGVTFLSHSPASGSTFPVGTTTVTVTAMDGANNVSQGTFTITVQDTIAPALTLPANQTLEATSAAGAVASFAATATDAVGVTALTYSAPSGSTFPIGITTVTATAKDAANNTTTGSFTITVQDTIAPALTLPANQTLEATSAAGAVASFAATATDAVGVTSLTYSAPSGSTFPIGITTVTVTAKDAANNTSSGTFTITVRDTTAPALTVPANQTLEATSAAGAVASFAATVTDAVGVTSLTTSAPSGATFPIGTTTVTVTAKDAANNTTTGSFTITVRDTTAPAIASLSPSSATLWPPNHKMVPITLSALASDAVGVSSLKIISVTSNEPDNGLGDGDTANDIQVTGALTLNLRAERSGKGSGRIYTITVEARDVANNASTKTVTVSVPKN